MRYADVQHQCIKRITRIFVPAGRYVQVPLMLPEMPGQRHKGKSDRHADPFTEGWIPSVSRDNLLTVLSMRTQQQQWQKPQRMNTTLDDIGPVGPMPEPAQ